MNDVKAASRNEFSRLHKHRSIEAQTTLNRCQAHEYSGSQSLGQGPGSCKLPWRLLSRVTPESPGRAPGGIPIAWEEAWWDPPSICRCPGGWSAIRLGYAAEARACRWHPSMSDPKVQDLDPRP